MEETNGQFMKHKTFVLHKYTMTKFIFKKDLVIYNNMFIIYMCNNVSLSPLSLLGESISVYSLTSSHSESGN